MSSTTVQTILNHLRYIINEGWIVIEYRLFLAENEYGAEDYVLALEYYDGNRENKSGQFWHVPEEDLEAVKELISDMKLQPRQEPTEEEMDADDENGYQAGYREGFADGYGEGRRHEEEERDRDDWEQEHEE